MIVCMGDNNGEQWNKIVAERKKGGGEACAIVEPRKQCREEKLQGHHCTKSCSML